MEKSSSYSIGVDVGGTNTDAVILEYPSKKIVSSVKVPTTKDFSTGIIQSIKKVLLSQKTVTEHGLSSVMIGTTAFINALIQCSSELSPVNVIRICGTVSHDYPPFMDIPERLRKVIQAEHFLVDGGFEFDKREIKPLDEAKLREIADQLCKQSRESNTSISLVVCGIFSPLCADHEEKAAQILQDQFQKNQNFEDYSITLSNKVGQVGLLEREDSAILNASVKSLARRYIQNLKTALVEKLHLGCKDSIYLTSNDGTLITCEEAAEYPVFTFNSGPTNSLRGAWQLCQMMDNLSVDIKEALVIDIGGTTSDIAVLKNGFPRPASAYTEVAGVRTSFRMPDTLSIGLGGGSLVQFNENNKCTVGPVSVGYKLLKEAKSFGGNVLTTSDISLASGIVTIEGADPSKAGVSEEQICMAQSEIIRKLEVLVDKMKTSAEKLPLILVGGGSILVPEGTTIEGVSQVIKPNHFAVANAVGAAIAQVSALKETIVDMEGKDRLQVIAEIKKEAEKMVLEKGAIEGTVMHITDEVHLSYALRPLTRFTCKAIGELNIAYMARNVDKNVASDLDKVVIENEEIEPFILDPTKIGNEEAIFELKPPKIEMNAQDNRKEWILTEEDVDMIALGAAILGTGGGGSPYLGRLLVKEIMKKNKIRIISPDSMKDDEYASASACYGTPYVIIERMISTNDIMNAAKQLIEHSEKTLNQKVTCISTVEIGGINSMLPLVAGGLLGVPVVDVDYMGRAFPKYQMITPHYYGKPCTPVCMSNEKGDYLLVKEVENDDPIKAEDQLRAKCIEFGCSTGICCPPLSKKDIDEVGVKFSMSRAWRLGRDIIEARKKKQNPLSVIETKENGKLLFVGKIVDVHRKQEGGFTKGSLTIQGLDEFKDKNLEMDFQNENLIAYEYPEGKRDEKKCIATVPDLICMVNTESYEAILSEDLKYGLRVSVLYLPASHLLKTEKALKYIGPEEFGYKNVPIVHMDKEYIPPKCVLDEF